ncbi:uncharacterized protein LOC129608384 [Condylostylus longicornis]|uniref:uncharacterized protein LOC129608384 n=1 Tax=Condylostylus longicornis TaxID=2530218 RepID=UPI00244E2752|nr:uncharacterized protein LOC129608384 [Condylostylus longicornis]
MPENSLKYQRYAAVCVNIMSMAYGTVAGWSSPSFLILESDESPLESGPITPDETSWIGSISCIGGLIGNFLFGWLADRFGRKASMLMVLIPIMTSWILIIIGTNVTYLLWSRFLGGLAGGGAYVVVPLYVTEIAEDRVRGTLGSYLVCSVFLGVQISFILGWAVSYYLLPYLLMIIPIVFFALFVFLPETPQQLLKSQKVQEAEKALRYFRNLRRMSQDLPDRFKYELEKLKDDFLQEKVQEKNENIEDSLSITWDDFKTKPAYKSILIGVILMFINQFTGSFAMLNYTATIFLKAGSTLSPNASAAIVGAVQFLGAFCATVLIEKLGRKILLLLSTFGGCIGLLALGLFTMLDNMGYDVSSFKWIPIVSFSEILFVGSLGVLTVPFIIIAELTPPKIRSLNVMFATSLSWIFAFLMVKSLPLMVETSGLHGTMFFFAACSVLSGLLVLIWVPETKGRSIEEIMKILTNILSMSYGAFCGWPSSSFLVLQSKDSPLDGGPMTDEQASWVGSLLCVGGFVGNYLFGWLANFYGRKISMMLIVIPTLMSLALIILASSVEYLYVSRFLGGLAGGATFCIVPLYITEISEDRIRGQLGSYLVLSANFGLLVAYVLGCYKLKHDYLDDPHKSKGDENQLSWKDFTTKPALKAFVIGVALMALNQFCGCFAMINYTATIFVKAGSTLSPNISSIIVALIQLIGSYFSVILVERAGRKLLIAGSAFGTGIGHLCMGTFILLDNMPGYDVSGYRWVPLACFSFIIFIVSWGVSTLPFLLVSELCPPKIREIVLSVCISVLWFFAFFIIKYLSVIVDAMGLHGALFIFSACSFTGGIFVLAFVPETKGKINIIGLAHGTTLGWMSPTILLLHSHNSPFPNDITTDEESWIGSMVNIGGFVGTLLFGTLFEKMGRKYGVLLLAVPDFCGWITIYFSSEVEHLYIARFFAGLTGGAIYITVPIFIAEIADNNIRGILGSMLMFMVNFGLTCGFSLAAYLPFRTVPLITIWTSLIFIGLLIFLPDTPKYYLLRGKEIEAEKSLKFYKNFEGNTVEELEKFNKDFQDLKDSLKGGSVEIDSKLKIKDFWNPVAGKAFLASMIIMVHSQMTGYAFIINYASKVFDMAGTSLDPNLCTIILGITQIFGNCCATTLVDRFGRKPLFNISLLGMLVGLLTTGLYDYYSGSINTDIYSWIPILSVSIIIFSTSIGVTALLGLMIIEVFPGKIRSVASLGSMLILNGLTFITLKIFPILLDIINLYGLMWLCSGFCVSGIILVTLFVPETRGKALAENSEQRTVENNC